MTLADIGTAVGTLILAGATFVSVRASARSTRIAERALLAGQRPVLAPAGPDDPAGSVQFADGRVFPLGNGQALVEQNAGVIYLAIPLCNAGAGLALLRGYYLQGETMGRLTVDVLYGDHEGGQPSITRFVLMPEARSWRCDATRHWSLRAGEEPPDFGFT